MIPGFHFVFTAYGFWLPNDPRGSWSTLVRSVALRRFGAATKVNTRQSVAAADHDVSARLDAKYLLKHPPVRFTGVQARAIGTGLGVAAREAGYLILALAVLPDHVHLVMTRHDRPVDLIAAHCKAKATHQLSVDGVHPFDMARDEEGKCPSPWARGYWCVFLDQPGHVRRAIRYVEANPIKAGLRRQRWTFVKP